MDEEKDVGEGWRRRRRPENLYANVALDSLQHAGEEVRGNQPYRAARTSPLLAWPSASFLERITWGRERKGEPGGSWILPLTMIITDVFVIPESAGAYNLTSYMENAMHLLIIVTLISTIIAIFSICDFLLV